MIHEIGELDLIPEGISVERASRGRDQDIDYIAIHCRIADDRVRLRAYRPGPGRSIEWDVETLQRDHVVAVPVGGFIKTRPVNYFSDDPAPIWETTR